MQYWMLALLLLLGPPAFCQMSEYYQRAADMSEAAAKKYDAKGCVASAAFCRKLRDWNLCWVNKLAGKTSSCPPELSLADAPRCDENGSTASSSSPDPIKEMHSKQIQLQQELNVAGNASIAAYNEALANGRKESGALLDATLAGAQNISDPKASLAYTGIGLSLSLATWISEKKEAQREEMRKRAEEARLKRLEELKEVRASLHTSTRVFDFIANTTSYHYTNLRIEKKRGVVKNIYRKDLYDVDVEIHSVFNTADSIFIYESVAFKNRGNSKDSCVISKISIPFKYLREAQLYSGDYTNAYDPRSSLDQVFRHKNLSNASIQNAFTVEAMYNEGNQIGAIYSNLIDVHLITYGNRVKIEKKYVAAKPRTLVDANFTGAATNYASIYMLVLDEEYGTKAYNFVDYLNFIKN